MTDTPNDNIVLDEQKDDSSPIETSNNNNDDDDAIEVSDKIENKKNNSNDEGDNDVDVDEDDNGNVSDKDENETSTQSPTSSKSSKKKRTRRVYNGMIECNVEPIRSLITCTLCVGLYREPYTTLKCFHTFCKSCLITAIRASYNTPQYNSCPICDTYFGRDDIVTNNALPDRVLETLIDKVLFPHLAYQDYILENEFYTKRNIKRKDIFQGNTNNHNEISSIPNTSVSKATSTNVQEKSIPHQVAASTTVVSPTGPTSTLIHQKTNVETLTTTKQLKSHNIIPPQPPIKEMYDYSNPKMIVYQLIPYHQKRMNNHNYNNNNNTIKLPLLDLPFIKTSSQIQIEQIKKFLYIKLIKEQQQQQLNNNNNNNNNKTISADLNKDQIGLLFDIYCNDCLLEDELTINFIFHVIWNSTCNNTNTNQNNNNHNNNDPNKRIFTLEYKYIEPPTNKKEKDIHIK